MRLYCQLPRSRYRVFISFGDSIDWQTIFRGLNGTVRSVWPRKFGPTWLDAIKFKAFWTILLFIEFLIWFKFYWQV